MFFYERAKKTVWALGTDDGGGVVFMAGTCVWELKLCDSGVEVCVCLNIYQNNHNALTH